jgi:hypothetical protein
MFHAYPPSFNTLRMNDFRNNCILLYDSCLFEIGWFNQWGDGPRAKIPGTVRNFSVVHYFQTGSGVHSSICLLSMFIKQPWHKADHSPPSSAQTNKARSSSPMPIHPQKYICNSKSELKVPNQYGPNSRFKLLQRSCCGIHSVMVFDYASLCPPRNGEGRNPLLRGKQP